MTKTTKILRILTTLFYLSAFTAGIGALIVAGMFFFIVKDLPRIPEPLSRIIETEPTEIFAATGERIMLMGGREAIPLNRVSPDFIRAILATEDHRFPEHHGVDKLRTLKAMAITLFVPGKVQGASTITQQLAKNLFFSFKRSYMRKLQELMVALQIEARYSKDDILEAYVNQIPFGVGAYGIENAAQTFFGKSASDLNLEESALLAGIPKSPTRYNPYHHFERAKKRQRVVLSRMVAVKFISQQDADRAFRADLRLRQRPARARTGSYFLDTVIKRLEKTYGPEVVFHGGLKVTTTLDPQMQTWAAQSVRDGLEKLDGAMGFDDDFEAVDLTTEQRPQGALVAIQTNSGAVKALVGGRNYSQSEFNRAVQNNRLPGSGFKPFLYYTAFEKLDLNPASVFIDRPVKIAPAGAPVWVPKNFSRDFQGPMILKQAFLDSVNTIAAQLVEKTGPEDVIATARRFGIKSHLSPVYSVALGTSGVSPLEMAAAYATLATGGVRHDPFFIWRVEDPFGQVLEEKIVSGERSLDPSIAYQVVDMMRGVVDDGTGSVVRRLGFKMPAAGKTGTTNRYKDAWFTGFTPTLCTSVWVGFDRNIGLRDSRNIGITGGRGAAPIWTEFMKLSLADEPSREFNIPRGIHFESVDPITGKKAGYYTEKPVRVALRKGQTLEGDPFDLNTH
ncbi:MAG: PBP1A family penicillin-binding protein [Deltaproteobacteria bacterium]|nr:PBP1A family penicillin-binding protein [Deltaproteobacteria bacterium]